MRLVLISDVHSQFRALNVPEGDVLICAGDATGKGTIPEIESFLAWFGTQPHRHRLLIAGNHDWGFERTPDLVRAILVEYPNIAYLEDAGVEIDGVRFWGSPWQPWFNAWAFNLPRGERLRAKWARIPEGTDVLIAHGPPAGILDFIPESHTKPAHRVGCEDLRARVATLRPRLHVFGHIHNQYGIARSAVTTFVNASICDEGYRPVHRPIVVDLSPTEATVLGVGPTLRRQRLDAIQAILDTAPEGPLEIHSPQFQAALKAMAELIGTSVPELEAEYLRRGLLSNFKYLDRAEAKPSRRAIPIHKILGPEG